MTAWLARFVYSNLLRLSVPAWFARWWWRGRREPGYRQHWAERLGFSAPASAPGAIWIHAVSLGETHAAASLVAELRSQLPSLQLLLTHGTATGRAAGLALLRHGDRQLWLPLDTPGAVARFLMRQRPAIGVLMETEVWPNLLHQAARHGVTLLQANARLSERSFRRGQRWSVLLRPAAQRLGLAMAQTADDAARLRQMGVPRVEVCGNLKFDITPPPRMLARGLQWRQLLTRAVILAASTREGEEHSLLKAWVGINAPRPLLLLVPRHPQRFDEVAAMVQAFGLSLRRRSDWQDMPPTDALAADVWLGDSLGEMPLYYAAADVALLGGSFAPLGGHNLIEASACGCPIMLGPHTFNFSDAARKAIQAGAALRVGDVQEGVRRAVALAADPARNGWVQKAFDFATAHRGAARRMALRVLEAAGLMRNHP